MRVKARRALSYNKRLYGVGQEFEMPDKDAKVLKALGRVQALEASKPASEPEQEEHEHERTTKRRKPYKRRDMTAEDEQAKDTGED